jgi:hypothetical protein
MKRERVLGGDIETTTLEVLRQNFDSKVKELEEKNYGVTMKSDEIEWINLKLISTIKWKGQNVFDIIALSEIVNDLVVDIEVMQPKEKIKALFHFIANYEFTGITEIFVIKSILTNLSKVLGEVGKDEQDLRDAAFELQAAEQGILPETMANAAEGNSLQKV